MLATITNVTVSVVVTLSSVFSDGVEQLEQKQYKDAVKVFTKVVEAEDGAELYLAPALLMRSQCHLELDVKDKAKKDIETLFEVKGSESVWKAGAEIYKAAGGSLSKLMPKKRPAEIWGEFMESLVESDEKSAVKFTGEGFTEVITGALKSREFDGVLKWLSSNDFEGGAPTNLLATTAKMSCVGDRGEPGLTIFFERELNSWKISGMYPRFEDMDKGRRHVHSHGRKAAKPAAPADLLNLKKIDMILAAISKYMWEFETLPEKLDDLLKGEHLRDASALVWEHPETGKEQPFIYILPLAKDPDELMQQYFAEEDLLDGQGASVSTVAEDVVARPIVAAPMPVKGKRSLGMPSGSQSMKEDSFVEIALKEAWDIPGLKASLEASENIAKEVASCIKKMRKGSSSDRKAARDKLIEMGAKVLPELREFENDDDPEIKESVKVIISKIK